MSKSSGEGLTVEKLLKLGVIDVKDFMVLALLKDGWPMGKIAKELSITPSAVTQRTYRYKKIWAGWYCKTEGRYSCYKLSPKAQEVGTQASKIIRILHGSI